MPSRRGVFLFSFEKDVWDRLDSLNVSTERREKHVSEQEVGEFSLLDSDDDTSRNSTANVADLSPV